MPASTHLLERYRSALDTGDTHTVADCYAERFLHLTRCAEAWSHEWRRNNQEFRELLSRAAQFYAALGARRFALVAVAETKLHESHSLVRASWRVLGAEDREIVEFGVKFMVRVRRGIGSIVGVVAHSERRCLEQRGLLRSDSALYFDLPAEDALLQSGVRRARDAERTG